MVLVSQNKKVLPSVQVPALRDFNYSPLSDRTITEENEKSSVMSYYKRSI